MKQKWWEVKWGCVEALKEQGNLFRERTGNRRRINRSDVVVREFKQADETTAWREGQAYVYHVAMAMRNWTYAPFHIFISDYFLINSRVSFLFLQKKKKTKLIKISPILKFFKKLQK